MRCWIYPHSTHETHEETHMRQIVLDTETTGMNPNDGHRIIEIGCLEMINRRITGKHFHYYLNPERGIDAGAVAVHGLTQEFLSDKPLFATIAEDLLDFIKNAELIIHNAPFDLGFLDYELKKAHKKYGKILDHCAVIDTLPLARQLHPGQRNNLDALCKRYNVNNSHREFHGALLDAELLALVYLAMTGGQTTLFADENSQVTSVSSADAIQINMQSIKTRIITADEAELAAHEAYLIMLDNASKNNTVWKKETD